MGRGIKGEVSDSEGRGDGGRSLRLQPGTLNSKPEIRHPEPRARRRARRKGQSNRRPKRLSENCGTDLLSSLRELLFESVLKSSPNGNDNYLNSSRPAHNRIHLQLESEPGGVVSFGGLNFFLCLPDARPASLKSIFSCIACRIKTKVNRNNTMTTKTGLLMQKSTNAPMCPAVPYSKDGSLILHIPVECERTARSPYGKALVTPQT